MSNENHNSPSPPATTLDGLSQLITENQSNKKGNHTRKIPPLEKWQPKFCGEMDLTIKANGEWWHEGRKMTRQSLVDLFSSVLWAEQTATGMDYFLKTPEEKLKIQVEDAPLLVTQVDTLLKDGLTYLEFSTPQGDKVIADTQHPIIFRQAQSFSSNGAVADSPTQPYILVRQNGDSKLYALLHRNVFYHLINLGELSETGNGQATCLRLKSGDSVFELIVPNE